MTKTVSGTTTIEAQYAYDPYGIATKLQGSQEADFQYAGYYMHAPSGLNLTRTRQYSASLGRWISRDPIGERGGTNLYGYVAGNPISLVDPLGLTYFNQQQSQAFYNQAVNNATASAWGSPFQMLSDAANPGVIDRGAFSDNTKPEGHDAIADPGSEDTYCFQGHQMTAHQFGNFMAGAAGRSYDMAFGASPLFALGTVKAFGVIYHQTAAAFAKISPSLGTLFSNPNDPMDSRGLSDIQAGANYASRMRYDKATGSNTAGGALGRYPCGCD